jgi:hypothetical protein
MREAQEAYAKIPEKAPEKAPFKYYPCNRTSCPHNFKIKKLEGNPTTCMKFEYWTTCLRWL